jgi:hypothetical protein
MIFNNLSDSIVGHQRMADRHLKAKLVAASLKARLFRPLYRTDKVQFAPCSREKHLFAPTIAAVEKLLACWLSIQGAFKASCHANLLTSKKVSVTIWCVCR